ncbi:MAG TPA: MurR/RpiR family transcriptional regulator [Alcaligenes faecalis]|nr:MurR/RpiR family transcriptional regulator [Alcaligenes faecalis]
MPHSAAQSFIERTNAILGKLPASERRLAEFALDFPGDLAGYTASELAGLAQVSNATVTRFIRRLGYPNYEAARRQVRSEQQAQTPPRQDKAPLTSTGRSLSAHLQQCHDNLASTYRRIPDSLLDDIAQTLLDARKVWVLGWRSGYALASYFRWQLLPLRADVNLIPGPGETWDQYLGSIRKNDAIVAFNLGRPTAEALEQLEHLAMACPNLLQIDDQPAPEKETFRWHLRCDIHSPGDLDNPIAVMGLMHLVLSLIKDKTASQTHKK